MRSTTTHKDSMMNTDNPIKVRTTRVNEVRHHATLDEETLRAMVASMVIASAGYSEADRDRVQIERCTIGTRSTGGLGTYQAYAEVVLVVPVQDGVQEQHTAPGRLLDAELVDEMNAAVIKGELPIQCEDAVDWLERRRQRAQRPDAPQDGASGSFQPSPPLRVETSPK